MSWLLYGIIAAGEVIEDAGEGLTFIPGGGLVAVATQCDQTDQDVDAVLAFGQVVERIHRQTAIIPIRFGALLPDAVAVTDYLTVMATHYQGRLTALAGCEEMGVRLPMEKTFTENVPLATVSSGRDYLKLLKSKYSATEQAELQATALNTALAGLYRDQRGEAGWFNNEPSYLVSYLVPRATLAAFREKLEDLGRTGQCPGIISGPWPPYNFA